MKTNNESTFVNFSAKKLNLCTMIKMRRLLAKMTINDISLSKLFLDSYYNISSFPDEFYMMFLYCVSSGNHNELVKTLSSRNIYDLISYLKKDSKRVNGIEYVVDPLTYFNLPNKQIEFIIELIKKIETKNDELNLKELIINKINWGLRRRNGNTLEEFTKIAIKMYLSVGTDNAIDILEGKYGPVDYEIIYYLFNNLNVTNINNQNINIFRKFLFSNKKDPNNIMRLMLKGNFLELFINFDYFYNNLDYFIKQLGTKLNRHKTDILLKERYLSPRVESPELDGVILQEMISSYYHKYGITDSEKEIIDKNMDAYSKLKLKNKSSIIKVDIPKMGDFIFELLPLDDVRNLVMGYRSGNCFRINGEAFILFNNFLTNPHMRILSISTEENKDFGMVLLMRNGNVLIAQGIELSKKIDKYIDGEKLYNALRATIKFIMEKMNSEDDEIVASIIGLSNKNTSTYNHNILPFIINPILNNNHQYYNGIDNYQGLLNLKEGKTVNDIKLFIPDKFYFDKNNRVYERDKFTSSSSINYREIEKILISLRYARFLISSDEELLGYYRKLLNKKEKYTICTLNWFISIFDDDSVDSYINSDNPEIIEEYNLEMKKIKIRKKDM